MVCLDFATGAHSHDIPPETINNEVQELLKRVTSKPNFNPHMKFDPKKHIIFQDSYFETTPRFTLEDLKIKKTHVEPVSQFGATHPFPLLSQECIDMIIYETFQADILEKYGRLTNSDFSKMTTRLDFHVGGHLEDHCPFTNAIYHSPEFIRIIERFVGIKLKPAYNYDISHTNVSLGSKYPERSNETLESVNEEKEIASILGMHYDSSALAIVIMLDAPSDMVGGETIIVKGDETNFRIPDPKVGYCTVLQGRVIRHIATKPDSKKSNRIATVAGYVPLNPSVLENSCITSSKPSVLPRSVHDMFYPEWIDFRFQRVEDYLKFHRERIKKDFTGNSSFFFDQKEIINVCQKAADYLNGTYNEMELVCEDTTYPPKLFSMPYAEI